MSFQIKKSYTSLKSLIMNRFHYPVAMATIIILALLPYYTNGTMVLGGEGNVLLDFTEHLHAHQYQWASQLVFGFPHMAPSANGANTILLMLVENLTGSVQITNFFLLFLIYFLPFLGMYLLALEVSSKPFIGFLCASFYLLNPFFLFWLTSLNQFNVLAGAILPFNLWIIYKNYNSNLKMFLHFGIISTLFSSAYTNPPLHGIVQISTLISVYIVSYQKNDRFIASEFFKKYSIILSSFILFNAWWLFSLLYSVTSALQIYSASFAKSWLEQTIASAESPLAKGLIFTQALGPAGWDFFGSFYNLGISIIICLIPVVLVVSIMFFSREKTLGRLSIYILILALGALFLSKGTNPPFGFIYKLLFNHVPFFNIFKSSLEKFGLLFIFLFSVLLLFVLNSCQNSNTLKKTFTILGLYLLFCLTPIISGNLIPEIDLKSYGKVSRKYIDKPKYIAARKNINEDHLIYKTLSLPGMGNYQVLMKNYQNNLYSGLDPVRYNIFKPFIASEDGAQANIIYNNFMKDNLFALLGLFNVHKLIVNEDFIPWFGTIGPEPQKIHERLKSLRMTSFDNISIYTNLKNFTPILHSPPQLFIINHLNKHTSG